MNDKSNNNLHIESQEISSNFIESFFVGGLSFLALCFCLYNILARHIAPDYILDFVEEVQVYMMIWAVFLSLGTLTLSDKHIKSEFFINMFSSKIKTVVSWFSDILGILFSIIIVYYGYEVTYQAYNYGDVSLSVLRTPLWIYFASLPVGGIVILVSYTIRLKRKLTMMNND